MDNCVLVSVSPDRPNIYYDVLPRTNMEDDLKFLIDSLRDKNVNASRVIVYCRTLDACANIFSHFHTELGSNSYYPSWSDTICSNRLFGMFHASTPEKNKETILKSLTDPNGVVRIVFATVALGMGINLRGVNTIIHYGAPHSIDDYFQESGRGGRTGESARSIVYWKRTDCPLRKQLHTVRDHEVAAVRRSLDNDSLCHRYWLLDYFEKSWASCGKDPKTCCDICAKTQREG